MDSIRFYLSYFFMFTFLIGIIVMVVLSFLRLYSRRNRFIRLREERINIKLQNMKEMLSKPSSTLLEWRPQFDNFIDTLLLDSPVPVHPAIGSYGSLCLARDFKEPNRENILSEHSKIKVKEAMDKLQKGLSRDNKESVYLALTNLALTTFAQKGHEKDSKELEKKKMELFSDLKYCRENIIKNEMGAVKVRMEKWLDNEHLEALPPQLLVPLIYIRDKILGVSQRSEVLFGTRLIREYRKTLASLMEKISNILRKESINYEKILNYMAKEQKYELRSFGLRRY